MTIASLLGWIVMNVNSLLKKELRWPNVITEKARKKEDHEIFLAEADNCSRRILEANNYYIRIMTCKFNDPGSCKWYYKIMLLLKIKVICLFLIKWVVNNLSYVWIYMVILQANFLLVNRNKFIFFKKLIIKSFLSQNIKQKHVPWKSFVWGSNSLTVGHSN